jgi:acyl carrier protein
MTERDAAASVRVHLAGTLLALPPERWPDDDDDVFEHGMDSLTVIRLLVFVEREFGVELPDDEITVENLRSIRSIARWIDVHRGRRR